jgi:uncharacterized membrane protein YbaN (DUF454 family)
MLAAACFAKSSPKFYRWLIKNRVFGPLILNWQKERYIEPKTKLRALSVICLTFLTSIILVDPFQLKLMLVVIWLICFGCVARLSTIPKSQRVPSS